MGNCEHEWTRDELLGLTTGNPVVPNVLSPNRKIKKPHANVKPYFRVTDFNNQGAAEGEYNTPVNGYEVGVEISF